MEYKRPTLQTIADKVGVTKMTVSRYLKNKDSVALKTGEKIAKVIEDLGYTPSRIPNMMSQERSRCLGLLIPSFSNAVFSDVIRAVHQRATESNYNVVIAYIGYDVKEEEKQIAFLLSYQIDGIILTESEHSALTIKRLKSANVSVAEIMSYQDNPLDICVGLNHKTISYLSTKALILSGRKNIAYLGARLDKRTMLRQEGYLQAMQEANLKPLIYDKQQNSTFSLGKDITKEALSFNKNLDGIITTNDDLAVGALLYLQSIGVKIPEDISILGYNGLNITKAVNPNLCSIKTPLFEMGYLATDLMIKKLNNEPILKRAVCLDYNLTDGKTLRTSEIEILNKLKVKSLVN